jgi:cell division protein FtsX
VDAAGEKPVTRALVSKVLVKDSATLDDDTAAAVASVSRGANGILSVKMHDKVAALEKLARAFNMFKEQAAVNANLTPTIILTGRSDTPSAS